MNVLDQLKDIFHAYNEETNSCVEKFTSFKVSYFISNFCDFNFENLKNNLALFPNCDSYLLELKIGNSSALQLRSDNFEEFQRCVEDERKTYDDEQVYMSFEITKNTESFISIYDFTKFCDFWNGSSIVNILNLIKKHQKLNGILLFLLHETNVQEFSTGRIYFSKNPHLENFNTKEICLADNCHFGNSEEFPFDAHSFNIINHSIERNGIVVMLEKIKLLFAIISIFDITSISQDQLLYKLNGYKSFSGKILLNDLDSTLSKIYFDIFEWSYSDKTNISDKIGLARNIISLSMEENSLKISDSVFLSIQSSYKTYLQANISKYIELRNKIVDELSWISQKSGEIVSNYLANYQKSIFTFISFFISVFILRFLKDEKSASGFSRTETIFSLSFLALSLLFLFFSYLNLKVEKNRLSHKYSNLKSRYTDLLEERDIERILKSDSEFNYEISYIDKRKNNYTILWICTVLVLVSAILCVSDYFNWSIIGNFLSNLFHKK